MAAWHVLGKADTQAHSGQLDAAIATWKEMSSGNSDDLPVDAILIELARAYVQKGNTEEAKRRSQQIVDQASQLAVPGEARTELENLQGVTRSG
jgi:lipopolysaccharide biosynthesis regulator YciM